MKNSIQHIIFFSALLLVPAVAAAQSDDPTVKSKKSEIKVNKLDVIYEDEEYRGVNIDERNDEETEAQYYLAPFFFNPDGDDDYGDDEEDEMIATYPLTDDGVVSEDDIILEGFDTAVIHLPKFDVHSITEPIIIDLRNEARGERFSWPTPVTARPSSHYGPRWRRFHYGLDLAEPTGDPIYSAFDGVVRISKYNHSYGNLVIIHHSNGLETYYAHMSKRLVQVGQQVKSGDVIGLCGNTGRSFGSHLHFEIRYKGNALNPEDVVSCATHDLISDRLTITSDSFRKVGKGGKGVGGGGGGWYRVRKGDTLGKIARRNGISIQRLCQLNGLKRNSTIRPGQRLRVSGSAKGGSVGKGGKATKGGGATHTVRRGETLSSIARANGTSVKKLCQLNGIGKNSTLREGQKIRVK